MNHNFFVQFFQLVSVMLLNSGINPNDNNAEAITFLIWCVGAYHSEAKAEYAPKIIDLFITHEWEPNTIHQDGNSILHIAVRNRCIPCVVEKLVDVGVDTNITNDDGFTVRDMDAHQYYTFLH